MGKIVVTEFMTLDGVIEEPAWSMPYWHDEIASFKGEEMEAATALLLGRVTYEGFAQAWPNSTGPGSETMNSITKHVVSTTLDKVEWNGSRLIKQNPMEEIARLRAEPDANLLVYGSATLIQSLIQHDLVDVYRLLIYPVTLGSGKRLFKDGAQTKLKLIESKVYGSGVIGSIYEPDRSKA